MRGAGLMAEQGGGSGSESRFDSRLSEEDQRCIPTTGKGKGLLMTGSQRRAAASIGAASVLLMVSVGMAGCSQEKAPSLEEAQSSYAQKNPSASTEPAPGSATGDVPSSGTAAPSSGAPAADPASVKWASGVQVVPATGPVKLPAPKTEQAALETTFQLVQRYSRNAGEIKKAKSTDTKTVEPYVVGRLMAQLQADSKTFAAAKWTFTGGAKLERILGLTGSYARTMGVTGKDGKKKTAKFGATWLRYCSDSSDVEFKAGPDGKMPRVAAQKRRVFEARAQYDAVNERWYLVDSLPVEGSKAETSC